MTQLTPAATLHRDPSDRRTIALTVVVAAVVGLWTATHRWAYLRAPQQVEVLAWLHPALPPLYYAGGALLAVVLAIFAFRGRHALPFTSLLLAATLGFGQLAFGPLYPPTLILHAFRIAKGSQAHGVLISLLEGTVAAVTLLALVARYIRKRRSDEDVSEIAHGSSRPATYQDLKKAGMFEPEGTRLAGYERRGLQPLYDASDHHVLLLMPSGAGKTSGPIVSTLLTNLDSAVVLDPKREIYQLTAGWRRDRGHRILYFSPSARSTQRWNPLAELSPGEDELTEIQVLAENLVTFPAAHREDHWTAAARDLFRLLALHSLYTQSPPTITHVRTLLSWPAGFEDLFTHLTQYPHDPTGQQTWRDPATGDPTQTHPEVIILGRRFLETPYRELGSIVSTLQNFLSLWGHPIIQATTGDADFSVEDLLTEEPITLYVALPYGDLRPLAPLLRIFLALLTRRLTQDPEFADIASPEATRPRINFFLDEFASLGRLPILEDMLAFFRGYGLRAHIAIQDLPQLHRLYGTHESITGNCQIHMCSSTLSSSTRRHASQLSGETTVQFKRRAVSGPVWRRHHTVTPIQVQRQLLTKGEVGALPRDQVVIYKTGLSPILATWFPYWRDSELARRAAHPPPNLPEPVAAPQTAGIQTSGQLSLVPGASPLLQARSKSQDRGPER